MSDIPDRVKTSSLWRKVSNDQGLIICLVGIRGIAERISKAISEVLPGFTDHSVKHMDAMWSVADNVITEEEFTGLSVGEGFILAASFYLHDLGMSKISTQDGLNTIKETDEYKKYYNHFSLENKTNSSFNETIEQHSAMLACRDLHASNAMSLAIDKIPGLDMYIIENSDIREFWGNSIGKVSASHHWDIFRVNKELGSKGKVSIGEYNDIDLGYVACLLRIIDYAHINYERADVIERAYRIKMPKESLIHWKAQEKIAGPSKEADNLKYNSMSPISDIDSWWLFYDMSKGLDNEIQNVKEYLDGRQVSKGRFSLGGVVGVKDPESFSKLVETENFYPIDVRFRSNSVERIIEILGGKSLYGEDEFAPLRELLQNSRDAIHLKQIFEPNLKPLIKITLNNSQLTVEDNGIGMNMKIITEYLLGIASNYWSSTDFQDEFGMNYNKISHVGKFGIGFLSVFMITNDVNIETQKIGGHLLNVKLKGLGQRGVVERLSPKSTSGTKVSFSLNKPYKMDDLISVVSVISTMIDSNIEIYSYKGEKKSFPIKWWKGIDKKEFIDFVLSSRKNRNPNKRKRNGSELLFDNFSKRAKDDITYEVENYNLPELNCENYRLFASFSYSKVLLYSNGFFVEETSLAGLSGIINLKDVNINAARSRILESNFEDIKVEVYEKFYPKITSFLSDLTKHGNIPSKFNMLQQIFKAYGSKCFKESNLPMISVLNNIGESYLRSYREVVELVSHKKNIYISYGLNTWTIINKVSTQYKIKNDENNIFIPLNSRGGPRFGSYNDDEDFTKASLIDHFKEKKYYPYEGLETYNDSFILFLTIEAIAKGKGVSVDSIVNSDWIRNKDNYIIIELRYN